MQAIFVPCAEEHIARLNAEGQAADSNRRLQVAQEQVAEFAQQREEEASKLLQEVGSALASLEACSDPSVLTVLQAKPSSHRTSKPADLETRPFEANAVIISQILFQVCAYCHDMLFLELGVAAAADRVGQ